MEAGADSARKRGALPVPFRKRMQTVAILSTTPPFGLQLAAFGDQFDVHTPAALPQTDTCTPTQTPVCREHDEVAVPRVAGASAAARRRGGWCPPCEDARQASPRTRSGPKWLSCAKVPL